MKVHEYYVYILTNKSNSVLYVGVTSDIHAGLTIIRTKYLKDLPQLTIVIS
jgi:predicted GIY-YIG superfamily endonuclease